MSRLLCACLVASFIGGFAVAQPKPAEPIKLEVSPAKPPSPALKYTLLPEVRDQTTGNAATLYYRALSPEWYATLQDKESQKRISMGLIISMNLFRQTPRKDIELIDHAMLKELDMAARRSHCDWELIERAKKDGIGLLMPELQSFRQLDSLLNLRTRREIADGEFGKAAHSLQTALQMARHIGDGQTLIHGLVGLAIAGQSFNRLEEWIRAPGSPNLYWALTDLPSPFIDMRKNFQGERFFVESIFPGMRERMKNDKSGPMTDEEIRKVLDQLIHAIRMSGETKENEWVMRAGLAVAGAKVHAEAKRHFIEQGRPKELVDAMPVMQVAVMYAIDEYDRYFDEMFKWHNMPYAEAKPQLDKFQKELVKLRVKHVGLDGIPFASLILPAVHKVHEARMRLDRRIAALRCVEAIRLHAAANDGKPPAKLADIKEVPVPNDPMFGKPFAYKVEGNTITLEGPAPEGAHPGSNILKYEITFRK